MRASSQPLAVVVAHLVAVVGLTAPGCARYDGPSRPIAPAAIAGPGWLRAADVALVEQRGDDDCGLAAAAIVLGDPSIAGAAPGGPEAGGTTAGALRDLLRRRGRPAHVVEGTLDDLTRELAAGRPVIVGTVKRVGDRALPHFEVVVALHPANRLVVTLDPAAGWRQSSYDGFDGEWRAARRTAIVVPPSTTAELAARDAAAGAQKAYRGAQGQVYTQAFGLVAATLAAVVVVGVVILVIAL